MDSECFRQILTQCNCKEAKSPTLSHCPKRSDNRRDTSSANWGYIWCIRSILTVMSALTFESKCLSELVRHQHHEDAWRMGCETHTNNWRWEGIPLHCNLLQPTMAMFLYVLFLVLSAYNTNGALVAFNLAAQEDPDSCKNQLKRTLFGIVWSCVSTTILCAWTAVHPNIPPWSKLGLNWGHVCSMLDKEVWD